MKTRTFNRDDCRTFDYLVVGAGITGATIARTLAENGFTVGVFEQRKHVAGNCYTVQFRNIDVHKYGAHIFRTSSKKIWDFVNSLHPFHPFNHKVMVEHEGKQYSFPINYTTLQQVYPERNIKTPAEAKKVLDEAIEEVRVETPANLEEQAKNLVGERLFNIFIKGYTEKQWGRQCNQLPPEIIKRIPVRFLADDNYFPQDKMYQGIPEPGGYTRLVENMLTHDNITVFLGSNPKDFMHANYLNKIFYTGALDDLFNNELGTLGWRSLKFDIRTMPTTFYQPTPVVNYTSAEVPYTRIIEHKQFDMAHACMSPLHTIITHEYPADWKPGDEKYYPINTEENNQLFYKYRDLCGEKYPDIIPCGRLGHYKYYDMDVAIEIAIQLAIQYSQCGC